MLAPRLGRGYGFGIIARALSLPVAVDLVVGESPITKIASVIPRQLLHRANGRLCTLVASTLLARMAEVWPLLVVMITTPRMSFPYVLFRAPLDGRGALI